MQRERRPPASVAALTRHTTARPIARIEPHANRRCSRLLQASANLHGPLRRLADAWMNVEGHPDELCERCLRGLSERANSEGLDVPWKDAHAVYEDARWRYTEPITTSEALETMPLEEENRIYAGAYLT